MIDTAGVVDFDRDVRAITHAASRIAAAEGWTVMTPELLLLAALQDEGIRGFWGRDAAEAAAVGLRAALADRAARAEPGPPDDGPIAILRGDPVLGKDGWSVLGHLAIAHAMRRASRRGHLRPPDVPPVAEDTRAPAWSGWSVRSVVRTLSRLQIRPGTWIARGDLLHGIASSPVVHGRDAPDALKALKALPRLYGALDEEDPPVPGGDATGQAPPPGVHRASVVLDDDRVSTMDAVTTLLVEVLRLTPDRAALAMHRVHFRGAERVVTLPWDEARDAVAACRARAAELAPELVVRLVPA